MKTILITGSSRGIGYGLAENFCRLGHRVVLNGRNETTLAHALETLQKTYPKAIVVGKLADMGDYKQVVDLWNFGKDQFGEIDIWINNAGIGQPQSPFWELEPDLIEDLIQVNTIGAMYGAQVALTGFLEQERGAFYNMEGLGSDGRVIDGLTLYGTSKRALNYLTQGLAAEVKGTDIIVGAISPGMVLTDFILKRYEGLPAQEWESARRIFNILADHVDTVTPYLAEEILKNKKNGARIRWLTPSKAIWRFLTAGILKRDLLKDYDL